MNTFVRACSFAVLVAGLAGAASAGRYGKPPLTFERRGTEADGQPFVAHVSGHTVAFGHSGTVLAKLGANPPEAVLRFAGARLNAWPHALGPRSGTANYFLGSRPEQWHTDVPMFKRIEYTGLYPGINLIYYGNQNRLEYDLVVAPGASWRAIGLAFDDSETVQIDSDGGLKLQGGSGWMTHARPAVYQVAGNGRRQIAGHYVRKSAHEIGFEIGAYDPRLPLIIDPTILFASYLGGSGDDYAHAVAIDSSGCAYVVGETGSWDFPTRNPERASMAGDTDIFVTKWNASGKGLVYSTYIGGSNRDVGLGIALDQTGNAYVTGFTYSGNFPITSGALRSSFVGDSKAFALKLNSGGNALVYSTFLGGSGDDYAAGIAVDAAGEAHLAGYTSSVDFPVTAGAFQPAYGGGAYDGFLAKLNAAGSALIFATYLGGMGNDTAAGVALDPSGNIYVTGQTQSSNFPTLSAFQPSGSESDAFVVKMNRSGAVAYATYLGGTGVTSGTAIAADAVGNAYVTGFTDTADFPVTSGAYQTANNGYYDAFVAVLNSYGSSLLSATYLGGSASDSGYAIGLDGSNNVYITGTTNSIDFPVHLPVESNYSGDGDAFAAAFNNQLSSLLYGTYFGGGGNDMAAGMAVDSSGNAYITGWTSSGQSSLGLPITPGAFQPIGIGGIDAFLVKIADSTGCPPAVTTGAASAVTSGTAAVSGTANPNQSDTQVWLQYSTSSSMTGSSSTSSQNIGSGTSPVPVNASLTGLLPGTTYFYQAWGSNTDGTSQGGVMSFTTSSAGAGSVSLTSSPAGASITVAGAGCAPGTYTAPAEVTWNASAACNITFTDPQSMGGGMYKFQSSTLNGSSISHSNPLAMNYSGGSLTINATFAAASGTSSGGATHFSVNAASTAAAGLPIQFTVTALNGSNQTVATYTDPVHFASTDPAAVLPADAALTNGMGTFSTPLATLGTRTITASDLLSSSITGTSASIAVSQSTAGLRFVSMPPCRIVDTRDSSKPSGFGPPSLVGAAARSFTIPSGPCSGIPANAQAYALNVTVVPHGELGYITVWPTGQNKPLVSTLNSLDGEVKANAAIVAAGTAGAISAYATNNTDLILDINGYFVPASQGAGLAFYPMTPCRLVDTRAGATSTIVTGTLAAASTTTLPILTSSCGVPAAAQAYSLNFTLVPPGPVGFLTVYPTGESRPIVSTLNDPTGTVEANAAIAPVGSGGDINVYVTNTTDLLVDINGYFAPAGTGGLSLYTLPPCRVLDTRNPTGAPPFDGTVNVNVEGSGCGGTSATEAYVFNATVVPQGFLGYLTLWPEGNAKPVVSTLNANTGEVTSNMAIVPTSSTQVSGYTSNGAYLILDIAGYFAP